jgi:hypothetical protein
MQILSTKKDCRSARNKIDVDFFVKIRVGPDEDKSVLSFLSADTMLDTNVITMMLACSEDVQNERTIFLVDYYTIELQANKIAK